MSKRDLHVAFSIEQEWEQSYRLLEITEVWDLSRELTILLGNQSCIFGEYFIRVK